LSVSACGIAAIAAPCSRASATARAITSGVTERACRVVHATCVQPSGSTCRPRATECWRCSPPSVAATSFAVLMPLAASSSRSVRTGPTSTMPSMASQRWSAS
jgi:hypothetical protein